MRLVLIDDTNSSIQYSGPWFEVENTQINTGGFGPPFQNTLHGVTANANFSFPFSGSAVLVYGTSIVTTNASGTQDPTWECFIDNTSIGASSAPSTSENNWILCGGGPSQFQDGPHFLTVKANASNQQTFWFDQIQYAPSASVSLNQSLLRIDSSDSAIQYSSGWESLVQLINTSYTQITGAALTYQFSGTSISWVGSSESVNYGSTASATYTVDDQDPINFVVPISSNNNTYYNQLLFDTGQLPFGQHKLVVTYFGNSTTVPLALNYFVQQDSSSSTSSINTTSIPSGSASNSSPSFSTTVHRDAIIGGVIGGFVLISLFLALLFFNPRRTTSNNWRSQALCEKSNTVTSPDMLYVNPFTLPSSNPASTFLSQNYISNGQSLPSHISSKFTQRGQPSDPGSTSSRGGISPSTLLQPQSRFSSPAFISPSSESSPPSLAQLQTNVYGARTTVPRAATEPSMQRSQSRASARFVLHEDSGVRIPSAVELPPSYTFG